MKQFKHFLLTIVAQLCSIYALAGRSYVDYRCDFQVDGICYEIISSTEVSVTCEKVVKYEYDYGGVSYSYYSNYVGDVVIPKTVFCSPNNSTYRVTRIESKAFIDCPFLTSITIPSSMTSINNGAFSQCSGLTSIKVDKENQTYDSRNNCNAVIETKTNTLIAGCESTVIPNNVTSIGESAFYGCSGLTSVVIPNSVTSIGGSAFYGCSNLRTVINYSNLDIVKGTTNHGYIGLYAYKILSGENINGLYFEENNGEYKLIGYWGDETNLILPENYNGHEYEIGSYAFSDCSRLTSVTIPNSVTNISDGLFRDCN